jgi:hypothetical protein
MLHAFERQILRRIYGWRCRWNSETYRLYEDLNIVDDIEIMSGREKDLKKGS